MNEHKSDIENQQKTELSGLTVALDILGSVKEWHENNKNVVGLMTMAVSLENVPSLSGMVLSPEAVRNVVSLFDMYASRYDAELTKMVKNKCNPSQYSNPEEVLGMVEDNGPGGVYPPSKYVCCLEFTYQQLTIILNVYE